MGEGKRRKLAQAIAGVTGVTEAMVLDTMGGKLHVKFDHSGSCRPIPRKRAANGTGTASFNWRSGNRQARPTTRPKIGLLPTSEIETAVLAQVHKALQEPEMVVGVWQAGMALRERQEMDEPTVLVALRQMSEVWENLFPIEQNRIMRLLIERVQLHEDGLDIIWRDDSWLRFCATRCVSA